jgi:hypothetical protein
MAKNGRADRECVTCGQTWGRYDSPKCGHYRDVPNGFLSVKGCPERNHGNVMLMNCYVCPYFHLCVVREQAEVDALLATELPKPRKRLIRRGAL